MSREQPVVSTQFDAARWPLRQGCCRCWSVDVQSIAKALPIHRVYSGLFELSLALKLCQSHCRRSSIAFIRGRLVFTKVSDGIGGLLGDLLLIGIERFELNQISGCVVLALDIKGLVKLTPLMGPAANQLEAFLATSRLVDFVVTTSSNSVTSSPIRHTYPARP